MLFLSCSRQDSMSARLRNLESRMADEPEAVLNELRSIDHEYMPGRANRATYSLLLSQALDKNAIDVQSDSIISPAVHYFSKHGSAGNRLKMCYYRARIADNADNHDEAMEWLATGERYVQQSDDYATAGMLYTLKGLLYDEMFDYNAALQNELQAAEMFQLAGDKARYSASLISISDGYMQMREFGKSEEYLEKCLDYWDDLPMRDKAAYFMQRISLALNQNDTAHASALKDSCLDQVTDAGLVPWLQISDAERDEGDPAGALSALEQYERLNPDAQNDPQYLLRLSKIYKDTGREDLALESYEKFLNFSQMFNIDVLTSDTRFIEERYRSQITELKAKQKTLTLWMTVFIIAFLATILVISISSTVKMLRRKLSQTQRQYDELMSERDALLSFQENCAMLDPESMSIINERLAVLDKVLLSHISADPVVVKKANNDIKDLLDNKDEFILSTSKVFSAGHPKFINFLKEANLDEWEIGYCCLYVMGMLSKDMEPFFSKNSSNVLNNAIRKKLDLPLNGQKLKSFLAEKYRELEK